MSALIIILSILALLVLLLLIPVKIKARYNNELFVVLSYMFINYQLIPEKEKSKNVKKENKKDKTDESCKEKDKSSLIKDIIKNKGLDGLINIFKSVAEISTTVIKGILNHLIIKKIHLDISVSGEDAAETAIKYGYACAGIYPPFGILLAQTKKCEQQEINIYPNFDKKQVIINGQFVANIKLIFILFHAIKCIFNSIKLIIKIKREGYLNN